MKKMNYLIVLIMTVFNTFALFQIGIPNPDRIGPILVFYLCLFLTFFLEKKIHPIIIFIYLIYCIFSQYLGSILNFYSMIWWYDIFMHTVSGFLSGYLAIMLLIHFKHFHKKDFLFQIIFMLMFILSVAAFWELLEFGADQLFGLNTQHNLETGVRDTMEDILVAGIGGIVFVICYGFEYVTKKRGIIGILVNHMN